MSVAAQVILYGESVIIVLAILWMFVSYARLKD